MSNDVLEQLGLEEAPEPETEEIVAKPKKKRKVWILVLMTLISVIMAVAAIVLSSLVVAPEKTTEIIMDQVTKAKDVVYEVVPALEPNIILDVDGGQVELDWCTGTWYGMENYRNVIGMDSFTAHNGCGGDVILNKGIGDVLNIQERDGTVVEYKVVDTFSHLSEGYSISDLKGREGTMLLQTCHWDSITLKFVFLERL